MNIQNILNIFTFFIIYSFLGWVLESITKTVAQRKLVNSGFLFGPFCPIYGTAAVLMILFLDGVKNHYITLFVLSFVIFSLWEYFVGWLLEKLFNTKYWDYSYYKFHIHGRVCLVNSITWGFLGVAFIEIIHPIVSSLLSNLQQEYINLSTIIVSMYILVDFILTTIKVNNINIKLNTFGEITNTIKEKLEELKQVTEKAGKKAKNSETLRNIIEELKQTQYELKQVIEKQIERFRIAFPNMTSEKISEFLKQKVELRKSDKTDKSDKR